MRINRELFLFFVVMTLYVFLSLLVVIDKQSCPIEDLLINTSDLPGDQWKEMGSRSYRDAPSPLGIERIGTSYSTSLHGIFVEDVYRFRNEDDTKNEYLDLADTWFRLAPESATWSKLELPPNISINAADYRLECSTYINQNRSCWYISRYENDVIEFKADMLLIKDEDIFCIIQLIDQKASLCR